MKNRSNVVYMSAARHPKDLIELVNYHLARDEFSVSRVCYEEGAEQIGKALKGADLMFCAPGRQIPPSLIEDAETLRFIQLWSSGYEKFDIDTPARLGVLVANNGGANKIAVAEHTLLLMLAVYKRLPESHERTIKGNWAGNSHGMDMQLLHGKTLGIIGLGAIGKEVAIRAKAFGMTIIYNDIVPLKREEERLLGMEHVDIDELFKQSDVLSPHLHLNSETFGMIGAEQIRAMRRGSVIINVSRAGLIDNRSLLEALRDGHISGAGFDVYDQEPTRPNDPLLLSRNVVCTPHSANTRDTHHMAMRASVDNLLRVHHGHDPLWVVNQHLFPVPEG